MCRIEEEQRNKPRARDDGHAEGLGRQCGRRRTGYAIWAMLEVHAFFGRLVMLITMIGVRCKLDALRRADFLHCACINRPGNHCMRNGRHERRQQDGQNGDPCGKAIDFLTNTHGKNFNIGGMKQPQRESPGRVHAPEKDLLGVKTNYLAPAVV